MQGNLLQFKLKPAFMNLSYKCEVKGLKVKEFKMTYKLSSEKKTFFKYPFIIPKKNSRSDFMMNLKPLNHFVTCTKIQNNHPETGQGYHKSRAIYSLTPHQVSLLSHSDRKEVSVVPLFQMEGQDLPVQDLALQSQCPSCSIAGNWAYVVIF